MKILLAAVNAKYIHSNLAVYSLRRYAMAHGIPVQMKEYTINQRMEDILGSLFREHPDVLCFSCYIWNISLIGALVCELHKILPDTKIWLGGPEVSWDAADVLKRWPAVKGIMRGEGEETFLCLADCYENQKMALEEVLGISFRNEQGQIVETPSRPPLNISHIPFPYEDLQDFEHRIIYYESSRGCPFSCSYCLSSIDKKLRFRSLDLVKKELDFFLEHRAPQVKFVDRTFNCKKEHSRAVWKYLLERDNGVTNFHFEIAADLLEEEDFAILNRMRPGLIQLEIGVQTTNEKTLKEIRRTMDFSAVTRAVGRIGEGGNIHQHLDLIAGLPFEDFASFRRSFDDVYGLHPQQLQLGFLKVLKGSLMWKQAQNYGLAYKSKEPYEVLFTRWISFEELERLKQVEEMVELYYNSGQFLYTMAALEKRYESCFACYEELGDFYRESGESGISHTRSDRYAILLEFVKKKFPQQTERFRELLTLDYYLRENAKSRPGWAGETSLSGGELKEIYRQLQTDAALSHYRSYDARQLQKMTHLEVFRQDVPGTKEKGGCMLLFDHRKKDPISKNARCYIVRREDGRIYCIGFGDDRTLAAAGSDPGNRRAES